jgi:hypothetical protein
MAMHGVPVILEMIQAAQRTSNVDEILDDVLIDLGCRFKIIDGNPVRDKCLPRSHLLFVPSDDTK